MVEYGNGISKGPAGQVGGTHPVAQGGDPFAGVNHLVNDAANTLQTLTPVEMLGLVVVVLIGLVILRKVLF